MILSAGSNAPVLTLPACRQTSVLSSSGGSASARILPWPSTGTRITRSPPRPTSISALSTRSEEHTSELQSQSNLVCRLLLEKKKKIVSRSLHTIFKVRDVLGEDA